MEGELIQDRDADAVSTPVAAARPALGLHLLLHLNGRNSDEYEKGSSPFVQAKLHKFNNLCILGECQSLLSP